MGAVPSRLKRASRRYLKGRGPKRLTREQQHMIKQYLPDFKYYEPATGLHRRPIASSHWESVFRRSSRFSDSSTVISHSSRSSHASIECRIRQLFDAFYIYLDHNAPHLKHVFRASLHVRSKVLVHISAGIRFLLTSEKMEEKMTELTKIHARFGVEKEFYNPLGNALIHAMKETSDGIWSNEIEDAWRRLFTHCSAVLLVYHGQAA
ncbi:hypothetical protein Poli38472_006069 [Pythium oligandrum]|uniref:Globin domain-containing protein n=1 Tax=Pythium oligandrum TaxID=41045 RepID=A0A8K1CRQ7_PYTOL|nr:hypothetical protein Poli38472_006069 [Pythium oligandrum]|eukprot:TMW68601.1 hypothetical protein Poli38472_006069 [Pythium oligandrum]